MVRDLVLVSLITLAILMKAADRNAFKIQIVLIPKLVLIISVKILVWERVELMRNAKFIIISHPAVVSLVILEIHLRLAIYQ